MRFAIVFFATTLMLLSFNARSQAYNESSFVVSSGIGWGNFSTGIFKLINDSIDYDLKTKGPLFFKAEYGLTPHIGIGINISYVKNIATFTTKLNDVKFNNKVSRVGFNLMLRANYHFRPRNTVDPYFGLAFGYRRNSFSYRFEDYRLDKLFTPTIFPIGLEATFGTRFLIGNRIGFYIEFGLARAFIQGGLSLKLFKSLEKLDFKELDSSHKCNFLIKQ